MSDQPAGHADDIATVSSIDVMLPAVMGTWEARPRRGTSVDEALIRELEQLILRMEQSEITELDRYPWPAELTGGLSRRVRAGMRGIRMCSSTGSQMKIIMPEPKSAAA